jgi:hypothetical protein
MPFGKGQMNLKRRKHGWFDEGIVRKNAQLWPWSIGNSARTLKEFWEESTIIFTLLVRRGDMDSLAKSTIPGKSLSQETSMNTTR